MTTQLIHLNCNVSLREVIGLENDFKGFMMRRRVSINNLDKRLELYGVELSATTKEIMCNPKRSFVNMVIKAIPELIAAFRVTGDIVICKELEVMLEHHLKGIVISHISDSVLLAYAIRSAENIRRHHKSIGDKILHEITTFLPEGLLMLDLNIMDRALTNIGNIRIEKEQDTSGRLARLVDITLTSLLRILIMRNGGEL
ncbi:MAG: hypothetical protein ACRCXX_08705 [Cetobacterium sp.]|uniref:hypothetical protein n=1 Tax=Cetobacterium sp. TaxID=2071632 RepID=UPI003F398284